MVSGMVELAMRCAAVLLLPRIIGERGIFWAEVAAWFGADLVLIPAYYARIYRLNRQLPKPVSPLS